MATETFSAVNNGAVNSHEHVDQFRKWAEGTKPVPSYFKLTDNTATTLKVENAGTGYALDIVGKARISGTLTHQGGPVYNLQDYGADPTNTTACDSVFNTIFTAMGSTGGRLYIPAGIYKVTGTIQIPAACSSVVIYGDGLNCTSIRTTSTTADVFDVRTTAPVEFHSFTIEGNASTRTAGAAITFANLTSNNNFSSIHHMSLIYHGVCLDMTDAAYWHVHHNNIAGYKQSGVVVHNTVNSDVGDNEIDHNYFAAGTTAGIYGIHHKSAGGLRVIGNKLNGNYISYLMQLVSGVSTSGLNIVGNNMENAGSADITFANSAGGSSYLGVVIAGNHLVSPHGVDVVTAGTWITGGLIANNTMGNTSNNSKCIYMLGGKWWTITDNQVTQTHATTSIFADIGGTTECRLMQNAVPAAMTYLSGSIDVTEWFYQRATGTASTTGAYNGSATLYATGDITVTFAVAFRAAPIVNITPSGIANGAISAVIKTVSSTQVVFQLIGNANSVSLGYYLTAMELI